MKTKRNYGGRHKVKENERKSEVIKVRLTKEDVESLTLLFNASYSENLSTLIRHILFQKEIEVNLKTAELDDIQDKLSSIKSLCHKIHNGQKALDYKPVIEEIKNEVEAVNKLFSSLKRATLHLSDLKTIQETDINKDSHSPTLNKSDII